MKKKIVLVVLVLIAGLSYILLTTYNDSAAYYITVEELINKPPDEARYIRLAGILDPHSLNYDEIKNILSFQIKDKELKHKIDCIFEGNKPDNLTSQGEILLEGRMQEDYFEVNQIMFQCPSKYEEKL